MVEQHQRWLPEAIRATFEIYRQTGEHAWVAARGSSMRPLIAPGARLLVEFGAVPTGVGEIILFAQGEQLIAHRVVAWRQSRLIAKGDAEAFCDASLDLSNILGVVRALRRSPGAPASSFGCAGGLARVIGHVSWWSGRSAAWARRAATILPDPLRRAALLAFRPLARVAAHVLLAPIPWVAQIHAVIAHGNERG
jgi:hypothetical protein